MNRIQSVDLFKLVAIIFVITIHTSPFRLNSPDASPVYQVLDTVIIQIARFAVPFFFVISGYFWGVGVRKGKDPIASTLRMAKKIALIFLAWSVIYLLPYNIPSYYESGLQGAINTVSDNFARLAQHPLALLFQGTKLHLWFLTGLLFSVGISAFFVKFGWVRGLFFISLVLYLIGLLTRAYVDTPLGIPTRFNTRNGPFFGTLMFATGYFMSGWKPDRKWLTYGLWIFCFGCALQWLETYTIWKLFGTKMKQDFVIGTYFMGAGMALASLSNHYVLQNKTLADLGKLTLGIYAVHYIFVDLFHGIDEKVDSPLWEIGYVFIVLILSALAAWLLSKNRFTRAIVA